MKSILDIAVVSNITLEPYFPIQMTSYFSSSLQIHPIPYGEQNEDEYLKLIEGSDIVIVWLNLEELYSNSCDEFSLYTAFEPRSNEIIIPTCKQLYDEISAYTNAHILWFLFEDYYMKTSIATGYNYVTVIDKINLNLVNQLSNRVEFIDLKRLIASVSIANAYDSKGKYRWNAPYSKALIEVAAKEVYKQYLIENGISKKCLILDCDNVLWGGILSEDGIENIKLGRSGFGRSFQDFQRFVLSLYYNGVILAVCSKNDLSDVMAMFRGHSEMVLKEEQIACFQVNWDDKPGNIVKIAEKLNIGFDSMVFVDDSPVEIEAVKAMLPEVTPILYKRDMEYEQFSCFNLKSHVSMVDVEKRNETYRTNGFREKLKAKYIDYADYIAALEIKIDIHEAASIEYSRISELTQRTNKCSNGKRYTVAEIKEHDASEGIALFSVSVSDRFSDLGLVGAIEVESDTLTLFSLSCRALGKEVEGKMIEFITNKYQIKKVDFKSTGKNEETKRFLLESFPHSNITKYENS